MNHEQPDLRAEHLRLGYDGIQVVGLGAPGRRVRVTFYLMLSCQFIAIRVPLH